MATGVSSGGDDNNLHVLPASSLPSFWHSWLSWTYAGVDPSLAGNGGPDCATFVPTSQKLFETVLFIMIGVVEICYAWPRINAATPKVCSVSHDGGVVARSSDSCGRRIMLMFMCLVFGAELGFKLASQQLIWILNPCHLVTMMQVLLSTALKSWYNSMNESSLTIANESVRQIYKMPCKGWSTYQKAVIFRSIQINICCFMWVIQWL